VALILAADQVELYEPAPSDRYGWQDPPPSPPRPRWCGTGNLQLAGGRSDPGAAAGGGHGPYNPARGLVGVLYLPPEACPVEGYAARIRGQAFVLSQVREITDPGETGLGCWMAAVTGTGEWGSDGG
jgi:hypothetical protein